MDNYVVPLLQASFRDVKFPVESFTYDLSHDVVSHKYPDQDGARIEATGRNPMVFRATIPFFDSLARGSSETWSKLYPRTYFAFLSAMAERSTGDLVHPSFGLVRVKPVSLSASLEAQKRSGEVIRAEWIEAPSDETESDALFDFAKWKNYIYSEGKNLDSLVRVIPALAEVAPDGMSILDALTMIGALFTRASLMVGQVIGMIDRVAYRLELLHAAVSRLGDPKTWAVRDSIERLQYSLFQLKLMGQGELGDIVYYLLPREMTVAEIALDFSVTVDEVLELNPFLRSQLTWPKDTFVRRYKRFSPNGNNRPGR